MFLLLTRSSHWCVRQNSYLDLWSYTVYIIWRNWSMKSLTCISQGFDKCTKATLQSNCFLGTPPDDCFCLEIWSRYHDNNNCPKFKTILTWRSSKKMNKNKNLLILYYLWKKLSKFSNAQKKLFHAFSFQLCSTENSKFYFYVSLCESNCIKIQTISLQYLT